MLVRVAISIADGPRRSRLNKLLRLPHVFVLPAATGRRVWDDMKTDIDLILVDRASLPRGFASWIATLRELPEQPEVVVMSDEEDATERATWLAAGAMAVLYERLPDATLGEALAALVARRREHEESRQRASGPLERSSLDDFVSESPAMHSFMAIARRVVTSNSSLLILGETGVGKERMAQAIHAQGPRGSGPFIPINCGALPETLLEAELFGHEEGAFTGATRSRRGYFELAHGGTLFLDEIGDIPLHLQVKLLRVLEERKVRRVGSEQTVPVDVRLMAATNRNLEAEVEAKRFRTDLYYRLAVVTLTIPPLRDRREDIPGLISSYVQHFRRLTGQQPLTVSDEALEALVAYAWPGNVRELINVIERAVLLCTGPMIGTDDLPPAIVRAGPTSQGIAPVADPRMFEGPLRAARQAFISGFERAYVTRLLTSTGGRIGEAAERAEVDERSIYHLMRKHGIRKESFRAPRRRNRKQDV